MWAMSAPHPARTVDGWTLWRSVRTAWARGRPGRTHEHRRAGPVAVRPDDDVPLPVRPAHDRAGWLTAVMQTAWRRTGNDAWLRLTRFFGKILLINVAVGVVTGLVQEFQFGMNWSAYSRYVGDVFGAPLAIEGLAAFFLESTFLGSVDLRVGPPVAAGPPGDDLPHRRGGRPCPPCSSWPPTRGCSTRSGTRSTRRRAGPQLTEHHGRVHQQGLPVGAAAHAARRAGHRLGSARSASPAGTCGADVRSRCSAGRRRSAWWFSSPASAWRS